MLSGLIFYLFATVLVFAAGMVITARNPVHSVLFLILAFFNAAGLFILLGAEFVAMILVIVYVGAVAVLFLFVVMMLDISFADMRKGAMQFIPLGLLLGGILLFELITVYGFWKMASPGMLLLHGTPAPDPTTVNNTNALGSVLYTRYMLPFQASGVILLISMIGAIVLTHRVRPDIRRQKISAQVGASVKSVLTIEKVEVGTGVQDA